MTHWIVQSNVQILNTFIIQKHYNDVCLLLLSARIYDIFLFTFIDFRNNQTPCTFQIYIPYAQIFTYFMENFAGVFFFVDI